MQTKSRIFDDLAKVAGGAVTTLAGVKAEIDGLVRQRIERLLAGADMVQRDEFDAVKMMAAKARSEQERLEGRVAILEKRLGAIAGKAPRKIVGKAVGRRRRKRRKV
ncbi:MAG: accessory factor UbiK family protein [Rhodospirillales bacterium]